MTTKPEWAARAKARMKDLELTQEGLLKPLGVSTRGAVGHYFNGRRQLSVEQAAALATALGVTMDWLFLGDSENDMHSLVSQMDVDQIIELVETTPLRRPDRARLVKGLIDALYE